MSLLALNTAVTGLKVSQSLLDTAARNTSNVNTPGYTRKTLPVQNFIAGTIDLGARTGELRRHVDQALMRDLWRQQSLTSGLQVQERFLDRIQQLHGDPNSETNISAMLTRLAGSFNELSSTPESEIKQTEVVTNARLIANRFNELSRSLTQQRNDVQEEINQTVRSVNDKLERIARLNASIAEAGKNGRSDANLADERDLLVRQLSEQMEVTHFTRGDGVLVVQSATGRLLADERPRELFFTGVPIGPNSHHPGGFNGGIFLDSPTTGPDLSLERLGGELGALIDLRDQVLPTSQAQLDELAFRTAQRLANQGLQLFVDGGSGAVPADVAGGYVGFSASIAVEPAVLAENRLVRDGYTPPGPPPAPTDADIGDNSLILNIVTFAFGLEEASGVPHPAFRTTGLGPAGANLSTQLPANSRLEDYARNLVVRQSEDHADVIDAIGFESDYLFSLDQRFLNESGVDLDQELSDMQIIQQAYSANARVLQMAEDLFAELLNAVR